ncbi:ATP-binding protein [Sphingobium cloacae]|uniref:histidine kinase n=1 Tax=Sphingobium cloacae TaxID=120107 RepID=A0A1E1F1S8_9SPHN|nr:ATP-binding protein [Sphingobium cloacae]BAV64422.1 sensor histidine kinase [Sphingobium cloacae]
MNRRISLARQLSLAMAALAVSTVLVSTAAFNIVYGVLEQLHVVAPLPPGVADTTGVDVGIVLAVCVMVLAFALAIALRLARRIVRPLDAVGAAARRIARGDLAARVAPTEEVHGETALLVSDFNAMADRLQRMADGVATWNAQIAHELRTPLTVLKGRLQGAKDGVFPLDAALVDGLLGQVDGLARLVEDLRSVSLADSGRLELILADVDLEAELAEMAPMLRSMLEPAGFTLRMDLRPSRVRADAARVKQAVLALVDNASRHADPCELVIAVHLTGSEVVLSVADAGPGLPSALEDDAFRLFVHGERVGARSSEGSGLGLAIVRGIARAHGGDVRYRRGPDRFAFVVTIPRG